MKQDAGLRGPGIGVVLLFCFACSHDPNREGRTRDPAASADACESTDAGRPESIQAFVSGLVHAYSYTPLALDEMNALIETVRALDDSDPRRAGELAPRAGYRLGTVASGSVCYWVLEPPGFPDSIEQAVVLYSTAWRRDLVIEAPHAHEDHNSDGEAAIVFEAVDAKALVVSGSHRCVQGVPSSGCHVTAECSHRDPTTGTTPAIPPSDSDPSHSIHNAVNAAHLAFRTTPATILQLHTNLHPEWNGDSLVSNGTRYAIPGTPADALYAALSGPDADIRSCNDAAVPALSSAFCGEINTQSLASNGAADTCLGRVTSAGGGGAHRFVHVEQSNYRMCAPAELDSNPRCQSSFDQWAERLSAAIETAFPARY